MEKPSRPQAQKWSKKQKTFYELFILLHFEEFTKADFDNRSLRLFRKLSKWMGDKTADQCRNHHKKRLGGSKNPQRFLKLILTIINENYHQRCLGFHHFALELAKLLDQVQQEKKITIEEKEEDLEKAEKMIHQYDDERKMFINEEIWMGGITINNRPT